MKKLFCSVALCFSLSACVSTTDQPPPSATSTVESLGDRNEHINCGAIPDESQRYANSNCGEPLPSAPKDKKDQWEDKKKELDQS